MAFYKLFYIIHRRTDYYKLYRMAREMMFPEYYEELSRRGRESLLKLLSMSAMINGLADGRWYR